MKPKACGLALLACVFALDQCSKAELITDVPRALPLAPFFNLVMVWNHGISFGMLAAHDARFLLAGMGLMAVALLVVWLFRGTSRLGACGIGMVAGGALGNVLDRLRFGAVADFFDVHAGAYHWPAFNVADSGICVGVALLCAAGMLERK